jgi:1,4-alpha-glucan branching enzyme/maltooligosyltrehalose trehalohydrolase
MPFGAEVGQDGSVRFRLWAPSAQQVEVCLEGRTLAFDGVEGGWFELITEHARAGSRYQFRINGETKVSDPASRFQPEDVYGASEVVAPGAFDWQDASYEGRPWKEAVIYELHVGAFTPEGTFAAVEEKLDYLRDLGITAVELMPVADFAGARNWGYDGVLPYAPDSSYGRPEDLKRLVQAAHARRLMIFLDVVYNHFGPEGNYLRTYSPQFFTSRHGTPWGEAINFDGRESRTVRDFFIHNALYWLEEYRFDGLRLDAVHTIKDESNPHILVEMADAVRQRFKGERHVHLVLENADNEAHYLERGLYDAQWNDDLHHALHVMITDETDGYYSDYAADPTRQLGRCLTEGFAYQGDYSPYHRSQRGEPSGDLLTTSFVSFLQNHDQVGNRALGERILPLATPVAVRAAMEILLLAPQPPLLFMGEEFGAETPFLFFCDFHGELAAAVTAGRRNEFAGFARFSDPAVRKQIPDPNAVATFLRSKLNWQSLQTNAHRSWLEFYRQLLSIRQQRLVPLLRQEARVRAAIKHCDGRFLAVQWEFGNAVLDLAANLSGEWRARPAEPAPQRKLLYSRTAKADNRLAPWSVEWAIQYRAEVSDPSRQQEATSKTV